MINGVAKELEAIGFREYRPRKGTETIPIMVIIIPTIFREYRPRKGTETWYIPDYLLYVRHLENIDPERGRKLFNLIVTHFLFFI